MAETLEQRCQRLADLVVDRIQKNSQCSDDDLFRAGFTTDDLHFLGPRARQLVFEQLPSLHTSSLPLAIGIS